MDVQPAVKPALLGARLGLFAALATLVFFAVLYAINPFYLISPLVLPGFIIIVFFKLAAAYCFWKERKGIIDFRDALQSVFMVSVVSLSLLIFLFYLLFNYADPSLTEQVKKNIQDSAMHAFEEGRITRQQFDAAAERAQQFRLGAGEFFALYAFTLFIGFFYALVFAGVTRLIGREISARTAPQNN